MNKKSKHIKLFDPVIDSAEKKSILKVLNSKFWASGAGVSNVLEFENKFNRYINSKTSIAVNSGTAALNLACSLFNIKNKEVILPSLSFVSTAHCIIQNGGIPIFADIDPTTLCINHKSVEKLISKKTAAILLVHFGGMPCNIDEFINLKKKYNIKIIEDAAHAAGATYNNKKIGSHSDAVCFSFHPVKNLAMPTGGLISLNNNNYKKSKSLLNAKRWCGISTRKDNDYDVKELGWNYYMNEFSAAIGLCQLKKLNKLNKTRQKIAKKYHKKINTEQKMPFSLDCSYHFYWILVKNQKSFRRKLSNKFGIETGTHYKPIHKFSMYKNKKKLPITDYVGNSIITLSTSPNLKEQEIDYIITSINDSL